MILCKYLDSAGCLDVIRNRRLSATDPTTFNDPFEIKPGIIGEPDRDKTFRHLYDNLLPGLSSAIEKALPDFDDKIVSIDHDAAWKIIERDLKSDLMETIEKGLERASQSLRIICFCNPNEIREGDDILLWSHYGDKHEGVRIFFETDDIKILSTNLFAVSYSSERASIDITDPSELIKQADDACRRTFETKNESWEYEKEFRWVINLKECKQKGNRSYIPLESKAVRRIDFGCRCENEEIMPFLRDDDNAYQHVKLYKALVHEHRFSLEYKEIDLKQAL